MWPYETAMTEMIYLTFVPLLTDNLCLFNKNTQMGCCLEIMFL